MIRDFADARMVRFGLLLVPRFSLLALSCAVEAMRAANVVSGHRLYDWELLSADGKGVEASSGLTLATRALTSGGGCHTHVAVCGGERSHDWRRPGLNAWLRRQAAGGATVGALSDASFVVAGAGLYERVRSTIHWHCLDAYRERFPALDIRPSVFELERQRFSCAGGTAALDLFLTLVRRQHGSALATAVADNYLHERIRGSDSPQRLSSYFDLVGRSRPVAEAVREMEQALEAPLPIHRIAERVGQSPRQLDRLFRRHLRRPPASHYRMLRLARAARLLRQTTLSVGEIAAATGFSSSAHLARHFRGLYESSPSQYRRADIDRQPREVGTTLGGERTPA